MLDSIWYRLDEKNKPVACHTHLELMMWLHRLPETSPDYIEKTKRGLVLARTEIDGRAAQTTFCGIALGEDGDGRPLLWETMIFPDHTCTGRYSSFDEALAGHASTIYLMSREAQAA
jgi:hypothetical protein